MHSLTIFPFQFTFCIELFTIRKYSLFQKLNDSAIISRSTGSLDQTSQNKKVHVFTKSLIKWQGIEGIFIISMIISFKKKLIVNNLYVLLI